MRRASSDRAEFRRRDGDIETRWDVAVAPDQDAEVRRVTLINHGARARTLHLTSYAEVSLNPRRADQAHPAFAKLFLETEFVPAPPTLLCRRRPRPGTRSRSGPSTSSRPETRPAAARWSTRPTGPDSWAAAAPRPPRRPGPGVALSGTTGPVLDPFFSLRRRVRLAPGLRRPRVRHRSGHRPREAVALAHGSADLAVVAGMFDQAESTTGHPGRARHQTRRRRSFHRLAAHVVFTGPALRPPDAVAANRLGQSGLWPHAISGDRPIVLARVASPSDDLAGDFSAHTPTGAAAGWTDLVLLEDADPVDDCTTAEELPAGTGGRLPTSRAGCSCWPRRGCPRTTCAARGRGPGRPRGHAAAGRATRAGAHPRDAAGRPPSRRPARLPAAAGCCREGLLFWNGLGGFTPDGREYVIAIDAVPTLPPAPWTNVLANPGFGCLVTEAGLGYTWAGNSQMNRLTPWSNDPVSDPPGEAVYLRDEETGEVWTPTPPCGGGAAVDRPPRPGLHPLHPHEPRTGAGTAGAGPARRPGQAGPPDGAQHRRPAPATLGDVLRRVGAGTVRDNAPLQVVCERDAEAGACPGPQRLGGRLRRPARLRRRGAAAAHRHRRPDRVPGPQRLAVRPAALGRAGLSGRAGPALDPCAALMTPITLAPGQTEEVVFVLGQADDAGTSAATRRDLHRPRPGPAGAGRGPGAVGPRAGCRSGADPRRRPGRDGEPLAALPGPGLPGLGAVGVLPVRRGLRLPRPAPGRHGPGLRRPGRGAGADPAVGRAAVRGRGRAALVAPAGRRRRPHPHHRRPDLPAAGGPSTTSPPPATPPCSTSGCRS